MDYFGKPRLNPGILSISSATPVGADCSHCHMPILERDSGVLMQHVDEHMLATVRPMHDACFLRGVLGTVGHQLGLCSCNGGPGKLDDPKHMSARQAAIAAVEIFDVLNGHPEAQLQRVTPTVARAVECGMRIGRLDEPARESVMEVYYAMRGFPAMLHEQLTARDLVVLDVLCETWGA